MNREQKIQTVRTYFERLTASDIDGIIGMFSDDGFVNSPFLGRMDAHSFFKKLESASSNNLLTVFDVLVGDENNTAAAHFQYDWTLNNGDLLVFQGIDYFAFDDEGKFKSMSIFYDTHPLREEVGDKYENA